MTALTVKDVNEVGSVVAKNVEYIFLKAWKILENMLSKNMLSHMVRGKQNRKNCELDFVD